MNYNNISKNTFKSIWFLSIALLNSGLIFAMEDGINNNEKKEEISKKKNGINWDQKELDVIFETLPKDLIKEIIDYVFYDYKSNKSEIFDLTKKYHYLYLLDLKKINKYIDDLIKINDLKKINKNFASFLLKYYNNELAEISKFLSLNLINISMLSQTEEYSEIHKTDDFKEKSLKKMNILINSGVNVNEKDFFGNTALIYACKYGNIKIAILLIKSGADINIQNNYGQTALMYFLENEIIEKDKIESFAQFLINENTNFEAKDKNLHETILHKTTLMIAALNNLSKIVKFLIQKGAKNNLKEIKNILVFESKNSRNNYWETDWEKKCPIVSKCKNAIKLISNHVIYNYVKKGDLNKAKSYIFTTKLPVNICNENGNTLLHACAKSLKNKNIKVDDYLKIFLLILSKNPELIEVKNKKGQTPFDICPELTIYLANKTIFGNSKSYLEKIKDLDNKMNKACDDKNIKEIIKLSKEMDQINLDKDWNNHSSEGVSKNNSKEEKNK